MCAQSCPTLKDPVHCSLPARLLCPWSVPGKNIEVGCHFLLQGISSTQKSNLNLLCLLYWQADSLPLSHLGTPVGGQAISKRNNRSKIWGGAWHPVFSPSSDPLISPSHETLIISFWGCWRSLPPPLWILLHPPLYKHILEYKVHIPWTLKWIPFFSGGEPKDGILEDKTRSSPFNTVIKLFKAWDIFMKACSVLIRPAI